MIAGLFLVLACSLPVIYWRLRKLGLIFLILGLVFYWIIFWYQANGVIKSLF